MQINDVSGLLLATIIFSSCGKTMTSYAVRGEFRYYNRLESPVHVTIVRGVNRAYVEYDIRSGDSLVIHATGGTDQDQPADPVGYLPGISADTTTLRFNDTLCYSEYDKSGPILHNIASYNYKQQGIRDYVFYFDIDSMLVKLGKKCE